MSDGFVWVNVWSRPVNDPTPEKKRPNAELVVAGRYPGSGFFATRDEAAHAAKSDAAEKATRAVGAKYLGTVRVDMRGLPDDRAR